MIANKECMPRKIGGRVLIPHSEVVRIARKDHPGPFKGPVDSKKP
jgi:hypothetical protein